MPATTQPAWQQTDHGQQILRPFRSAPYPHASRENGFTSRDGKKTWPRQPHYVDSTVGLFIPTDFVPAPVVNYVMYFHGHGNNVARTLSEYGLGMRFAAAKVNAILIVPQGPKDASDSGGGKLELDRGAFAALVGEVSEFLHAQRRISTTQVGKIALSAHSGGYKVTAAILDHGGMPEHVTDVLLLDASYGSLQWFADWCAAQPSHRLVSLYTEHLADENREMMALLDKLKVRFTLLDEPALTDEQLRTRRPLFMPTIAGHGEVPQKYFTRLLSTSALAV
jgi:hypothetical protein